MFYSIVLPTYNRADFIERAINSVLNQTFVDWELIIVDDGSTDDTKAIVDKYTQLDQRIKYYYQKNQERCIARNNGIDKASGDFICFLDSDDYFLEKHLELFYNTIISHNKNDAIYISNCKVDLDGIISEVEMKPLNHYYHPIEYYFMNYI